MFELEEHRSTSEELAICLLEMGLTQEEVTELDLQSLDVESPFIDDAFYWHTTPQGANFWSDLNDRQIAWMQHFAPIKFWVKRLYAYCHKSGCPDIKDCPEEHEECAMHLGLHTSIAWGMAKLAGTTPIAQHVIVIRVVREIVVTHFTKYPILHYLLRGLLYAYERSCDV